MAAKIKKVSFGLFIVIVLAVILKVSAPSKIEAPKAEVKAVTVQDVPELAGILSSDQTTRLKATRALAERVGVEEALEIVKNSGLPYTGEGHLAVHQIGFYAYKKYGKDAILHCKDYFLNACYHGAIIEAATDRGTPVIKEMADRCRDVSSRFFQCVHASGHAIMAIWNYDLPNALKTCDELFDGDKQYPDALTSCHNGAFMENLFGVHDWGTDKTPKRDWLSQDPYFPCTAFGEKYQKGCWLNQAARIYALNNGDLVKTAKICKEVANHQYSEWCLDNLARQIHPLTEGSIQKVFAICQTMGEDWYDKCVKVNAGAYYSVGDRQLGIQICSQISLSIKQDCFQTIFGQILGDGISQEEKVQLCQSLDKDYENQCFDQIYR